MIIQPNNSRTDVSFSAKHVDARKGLIARHTDSSSSTMAISRFSFAHFDFALF
jgi:hypothetical protein